MTDDTTHPKVAELEARLADMEARTTQRLLQSELKSHAMRAGMIDLDALKLIDTSDLALADNGDLEGAERIMHNLKRAKPYLFAAANTSTPAATPPSATPVARRATDMSHAEWQSARAELLKRRP